MNSARQITSLHADESASNHGDRDPFLMTLGERVRAARARKGMARRALSEASGVSERHLANLELGTGNASIMVLRQIAKALSCQLAELTGDEAAPSVEWALIRDLLRNRSEDELRRGRVALQAVYNETAGVNSRQQRIALVGLRGAGKSSLGKMIADDMGLPFVELNREIERVAGCSLGEIHNLLGLNAYRRYEHRALEETIQLYPEAVIATPGGVVSDPTNFNLLLGHCWTVWLMATPAEHMRRVLAQGDMRPMSGNHEAMQDLKRILNERSPFYAKADLAFDTSGKTVDEAFSTLRAQIKESLGQ